MQLGPFSILAATVWLRMVIAVANTTTISPPGMRDQIPIKSWIQNFSCLFYDKINMNCTWDISGRTARNQQFALYYKNHNKPFAECESKNWGDQGHASCHLQGVTSYFNVLYLRINTSETILFETEIEPLMQFYKYNPPVNVTVFKNNSIAWEHIENNYLTYQLNFITSDGSFLKESRSNRYQLEMELNKYTVKVRACYDLDLIPSNKLWSDWSASVQVEKEPEPKNFALWVIAISAVVCVSLIVLLVGICIQRYRLWAKLFQPIPDPKKMFVELFEDYKGDFQSWVKSSIPVAEEREACHPITAEGEN